MDENAARELELYIENDYGLVGDERSRGKQIEKMLLTKIERGAFDREKSVRAWEYLIEDGAKKYAQEYASGRDWSKMFDKTTRTFVAKRFADQFADDHAISPERAKLEQDVWNYKHRDFRGIVDGQRHVMHLEKSTGATVLSPLRKMTDDELRAILGPKRKS